MVRRVGPANAGRLLGRRFLVGKPADGLYPVRAAGLARPLYVRPHSSDPIVFSAILRNETYGCVGDIPSPGLVIDCGANVGFASVYFLNRFPGCRVIAVEPDLANYAVLERNLAPFADRVKMVRSGVWSHPAGLKMNEESYRDGRDWARMVRECRPGEQPEFTATDIGTLLAESGADRISILKIDVEKAETEIFARNYESWIDRVDVLVIELHDDECRNVFFRALSGRPFQIREAGELTVCHRQAA
ncbi:SAM-dependent methyltransferase [Fimbriiglobus ruber]|uniref:SAM-dependent methyltransferase n=1 Tax=Fimbriiglobus ruber TaxID=1908690 RepID=A0A225D8M7_9BACT|nr:SAM-dependent methyltransferase [Fimbriiglobus ruber]